MDLSHLQVNHVRNLKQLKLQDLKRVNVFFGANGSGKTSVLESIHLLGMARSFRGNSIRPLISHGETECTVFGRLKAAGSASGLNPGITVGVQRKLSGDVNIKLGGTPVRSAAELAEHFPLQVITSDSFELLTGSPAARRQYLDWGVFHVEHRFYEQWQRFQRGIKQRNKLLRRGKITASEIEVWTRDLASAGTAISDYREGYFRMLEPRFLSLMAELAPALDSMELRYRRGWDKRLSYTEALESSMEADIGHGYTHVGPQRADMRVLTGGYSAAETLSRGQQKLVVCALKLAQGQIMSETGGSGGCTYLVDDLPSELDEQHSRHICALLSSMEAQVFVTCVDARDILSVWPSETELAVFHVEHGEVGIVKGTAF